MFGLLDVVLDHVRQNSLVRISSGYEEVQDRVLIYPGARPVGRWHGHGFLDVHPRTLLGGLLTPVTVRKQRWCCPDRSATRHSQTPDDLGLRFDGLAVAVTLVACSSLPWACTTSNCPTAPSAPKTRRPCG